MPIPFEEKNEKIKVTCDLGISVDSEARIPVEVACGEQEQPVGSSEDSALEPGGGSLTDVSARAIYTAAPLVKAKKKRLPELVSLIVGILPLFAFLTVLVSDPAAIPFLQAEYFDGMTPKVIEDINRAYSVRHGMDILAERARIYHLFGNHREEAADYLTLLRNKVALKEALVYGKAAEFLMQEEGATNEARSYLRTAIQLSRPTSPLLLDFYLKGFGIYSSEDANLLFQLYAESLFCGDEFTIKALSKMKLDNSGLEDTSLALLKAQAWRELGDDTECRRKLDSINLDSLGSSHFGSMVYCFKMLSQLDIGEVDAAAYEMARYSSKVAEDKGFQTNKSLVDLTSAWILYSQGKYSEAYEKTVSMEKQSSDSWGGISAFQSSAANHLLRSHILLKLGRVPEAQKELAIYRKSGCLGTSFIPKTYRSWIGEAQAR